MENATKALLIAAAVLIVILIIALGMRIFNSTSKASGQAIDAGNQVSAGTAQATSTATNELSGILQGLGADPSASSTPSTSTPSTSTPSTSTPSTNPSASTGDAGATIPQ